MVIEPRTKVVISGFPIALLARELEPLVIAYRLLIGYQFAIGRIVDVLDGLSIVIRNPTGTAEVVGMGIVDFVFAAIAVLPHFHHWFEHGIDGFEVEIYLLYTTAFIF